MFCLRCRDSDKEEKEILVLDLLGLTAVHLSLEHKAI